MSNIADIIRAHQNGWEALRDLTERQQIDMLVTEVARVRAHPDLTTLPTETLAAELCRRTLPPDGCRQDDPRVRRAVCRRMPVRRLPAVPVMSQHHLIAQAEILRQDYEVARGHYHWRPTHANRLQMVRLRLALRRWRWFLFEEAMA